MKGSTLAPKLQKQYYEKHKQNQDLLIYLLTYSMEQSPSWEAKRFSASQEIPSISWNPNVYYSVSKANHLFLSWARSIQSVPPTSHFLKIYLIIILPYTPGSSTWSLSLGFPKQNPVCSFHFPHTGYMSRSSHSSWFDHTNIFDEEYRSLSSSLCSFLHSPVTWSLLGPNVLLSILSLNTLTLRSSLNVSDQVSYTQNTTGKIIVLYILIYFILIFFIFKFDNCPLIVRPLFAQDTTLFLRLWLNSNISCNTSTTRLIAILRVRVFTYIPGGLRVRTSRFLKFARLSHEWKYVSRSFNG